MSIFKDTRMVSFYKNASVAKPWPVLKQTAVSETLTQPHSTIGEGSGNDTRSKSIGGRRPINDLRIQTNNRPMDGKSGPAYRHDLTRGTSNNRKVYTGQTDYSRNPFVSRQSKLESTSGKMPSIRQSDRRQDGRLTTPVSRAANTAGGSVIFRRYN